MKKLMLVAAVTVVGALSACGGGGPCADLQALCDACGNATGKSACSTAVTGYKTVGGAAGDAACKAVVDAKTFAADSASCKGTTTTDGGM